MDATSLDVTAQAQETDYLLSRVSDESAFPVISGRGIICDSGNALIKQLIYKRLCTEAGEFLIYSENFGLQTRDLFGRDTDYVCAVLEERITDTLVADERIKSVGDFSFRENKGSVTANFKVFTIFGVSEFSTAVSVK